MIFLTIKAKVRPPHSRRVFLKVIHLINRITLYWQLVILILIRFEPHGFWVDCYPKEISTRVMIKRKRRQIYASSKLIDYSIHWFPEGRSHWICFLLERLTHCFSFKCNLLDWVCNVLFVPFSRIILPKWTIFQKEFTHIIELFFKKWWLAWN